MSELVFKLDQFIKDLEKQTLSEGLKSFLQNTKDLFNSYSTNDDAWIAEIEQDLKKNLKEFSATDQTSRNQKINEMSDFLDAIHSRYGHRRDVLVRFSNIVSNELINSNQETQGHEYIQALENFYQKLGGKLDNVSINFASGKPIDDHSKKILQKVLLERIAKLDPKDETLKLSKKNYFYIVDPPNLQRVNFSNSLLLRKTKNPYKFEIQGGQIGEGGMGIVKSSLGYVKVNKNKIDIVERSDEKKLVYKRMKPKVDPKEFIAEAGLAEKFMGAKPVITREKQKGNTLSNRYFFMPHVEGEDLNQNSLSTFPIERRIEVMKNFLVALKDFHAKNHAHLDLKPENIKVDLKTGKVTLLDFGLTKAFNTSTKISGFTGMYASREIRNAHENNTEVKITPAMDIFSAGVIVGELGYSSFLEYPNIQTAMSELSVEMKSKRISIDKALQKLDEIEADLKRELGPPKKYEFYTNRIKIIRYVRPDPESHIPTD